jgi:hypothetical protein
MAEGPFDKYQGPWQRLRESPNVDDRRDEPWPWHELSKDIIGRGTPTLQRTTEYAVDRLLPPEIPPITSRLQQQAGTGDVSPISSEELMKFLLEIESMNPDPAMRKASR